MAARAAGLKLKTVSSVRQMLSERERQVCGVGRVHAGAAAELEPVLHEACASNLQAEIYILPDRNRLIPQSGIAVADVGSVQHWLVCRSGVQACRPAMLSAIALLLASGLTQARVCSKPSTRSLQPR